MLGRWGGWHLLHPSCARHMGAHLPSPLGSIFLLCIHRFPLWHHRSTPGAAPSCACTQQPQAKRVQKSDLALPTHLLSVISPCSDSQ